MNVSLTVTALFMHAGRVLLIRPRDDAGAGWSVPERAVPPGIEPFSAAPLTLPTELDSAATIAIAVHEHVRPGYTIHRMRFFARIEIADAAPDLSALASVADIKWADATTARQLLGSRYDELPSLFTHDCQRPPLPVRVSVAAETDAGYEPLSLANTRLSARIAAQDAQGRLLLVKSRSRDSWVMPGGHYERGETLAQCAERETREEAGVQVIAGPLYWLHALHDPRHDVLVLEFVFSGAVPGDHPATFTATDEDGSLRQVRLFTPDELATLPNLYPPELRTLAAHPRAPDAYRVIEGGSL